MVILTAIEKHVIDVIRRKTMHDPSTYYKCITDKTPEINKALVATYPEFVDIIVENSPEELLELQKLSIGLAICSGLSNIKRQSEEICRYAFTLDPDHYGSIMDVNLRKELAAEALRRDPVLAVFVPDCPRDLVENAIMIEPFVMQFDEIQSEKSCWDVLLARPANIRFIKKDKLTKDMCVYCCNKHPYLVTAMPHHMIDYEMACQAVADGGWILEHIPKHLIDDPLCRLAIIRSQSLEHIPPHIKTEEFCMFALHSCPPSIVDHIPEHMTGVLMTAIRLTEGRCLKHIENPTEEMKELAASFQKN